MASDIAENKLEIADSKEIMTETIESILGKPTSLDCTKYNFFIITISFLKEQHNS